MKNKFLRLVGLFLAIILLVVSCKDDEPTQKPEEKITEKELVGGEIASPNEKGKEVTIKFDGKDVKVIKKGNRYFVSGDILIKKDLDTKGTGFNYQPRKWENNIFVYKIDPNFPNKERIYDAFKLFKGTNIKFKERTDEKNYVLFQYIKDDGCWSRLGMRDRGEQEIVIDNWGTAGTVAHEICHSLGLWHEQMRPDRDKYITINFNNITEGWKSQYKGLDYHKLIYTNKEGFDFNSIMLYNSWGCCGVAVDESKPIMTKLDGTTFNSQREKLSEKDIETINYLYPQLSDLTLEKEEVKLEVGQEINVKINTGNNNYTVTSSDTKKVIAINKNGVIKVIAEGEGTAIIAVKDNKTKQTKTIKVVVVAKTPDLVIEKTKVNLEIGKTAIINITSGSGNYTIASSDNKKVTITENYGVITIKAEGEGMVIVTVTDIITKQTKQVKISIKSVDLIVSKEEIEVISNDFTQTLIEITSGSGDYKITSDNEDIANVSIKDIHLFYIETRKKGGKAVITVFDNKTRQTKTIKVTVIAKIPKYVPQKGLVAWWSFKGDTKDLSPNKNDIKSYGATLTEDREGKSNSAYYFDGKDDYIEGVIKKLPLGSSKRTVSGWFKCKKESKIYQCLLNYGNLKDKERFGLGFYSKGYFLTMNETYGIDIQENFFDNKWYFFTVTYDGKKMRVYINGKIGKIRKSGFFEDFDAEVKTQLNTISYDNKFRIGGRLEGDNKDEFIKGTIDDIGIWNRVLTDEEILKLYQSKE